MSDRETVYFDVYVPELERYIQKGFKGRVYEIDGRRFRLFRTGTLAKVILRTNKTIANWERDGKIPKPIFEVVDTNYDRDIEHRWYSEAQIKMVQKHMRELFGDKLTASKNGFMEQHETFFSRVRRDWFIDIQEQP